MADTVGKVRRVSKLPLHCFVSYPARFEAISGGFC